jgi:hypothetical protein
MVLVSRCGVISALLVMLAGVVPVATLDGEISDGNRRCIPLHGLPRYARWGVQ